MKTVDEDGFPFASSYCKHHCLCIAIKNKWINHTWHTNCATLPANRSKYVWITLSLVILLGLRCTSRSKITSSSWKTRKKLFEKPILYCRQYGTPMDSLTLDCSLSANGLKGSKINVTLSNLFVEGAVIRHDALVENTADSPSVAFVDNIRLAWIPEVWRQNTTHTERRFEISQSVV